MSAEWICRIIAFVLGCGVGAVGLWVVYAYMLMRRFNIKGHFEEVEKARKRNEEYFERVRHQIEQGCARHRASILPE